MKRVYRVEYDASDRHKYQRQRILESAIRNKEEREANPTRYHLKQLAFAACCLVPAIGVPIGAGYVLYKTLNK